MIDLPGYRIERLLNWGAQGDVFLATDATGQRVAIKVVTPERVGADAQSLARLRREGRLLIAIDSPHVVKVREWIEAEHGSALVLEYLAGTRLDAAVRERAGLVEAEGFDPDDATQALPSPSPAPRARVAAVPEALVTAAHVAWALDVAVQFAQGVAELHSINLLHRDLKPQNAMLVDGRVVLMDFGFARRDGLTTLTQSGVAIGTLAYMSPEQFTGSGGSKQGDVYALGAVVHFCLCAEPPLPLQRITRLADFARGRRIADVRRRNRAVPAALAAVVARALEPDARDRHADAAELLADLERCARGEAVRVPFSAARWWRHHGRAACFALVAMAMVLLGIGALRGFDPTATAVRLLREVVDAPEVARRNWLELSEPQRAQVTEALALRVGDHVAAATAVAETLQLGLLAVASHPGHRACVVARTGNDGPAAVAESQWTPLDRAHCFLLPSGQAWFLLHADDRRTWWSADEPACLQLLVDVTVPKGHDFALRSLQGVAIEPGILSLAKFVPIARFPVGARASTAETRVTLNADIAVTAFEGDGELLNVFRGRMAARAADRAVIDAWFRHPEEPPEVAELLWQQWCATTVVRDRDRLPAAVSFWEAYRLAAWFACRLPTRDEWRAAATNGGGVLGSAAQRVIPAQPQPVDADPGWDRTALGVCFANSNVREWCLDHGARPGTFFAEPARATLQGAATWTPWMGPHSTASPTEPAGLRLYRTRLRITQ